MGGLRHHGGRAGAGAAAHTGGDKDHLGAFQRVGDLVLALFGGALADLGVRTGAAALGELGAQLDLLRSFGVEQRLLIGVHRNELDPGQAGLHHAVHSVTAAAAYADDLDIGHILHFFVENECHECIPLKCKSVSGSFGCGSKMGALTRDFFAYN